MQSLIKIVYLSMLFLFFGVNVSYSQTKKTSQAIEIRFEKGNWKEIQALAKKRNKYIFVDAYAVWCGPCKLLKSKTFTEEGVIRFFNDNFINLTIDMEKGEGEELADLWKVEAFPTLLFFSPEGKLIGREVGFMNGKKLIEVAKKVMN